MTKATKPELVCGVGVNDADYTVKPHVNGKVVTCSFYMTWTNMLRRCYSTASLKVYPSYIDCSVSEEWLTFSNFKVWMESQNWRGLELDKDLLIPGNKVYSSNSCVFLPRDINTLLNDSAGSRGKYPVGVYFQKEKKKFMARLSLYNKQVYLGYFDTPEEAHKTYLKAKIKHVRDVADTQSEVIRCSLHRHADLLEAGL